MERKAEAIAVNNMIIGITIPCLNYTPADQARQRVSSEFTDAKVGAIIMIHQEASIMAEIIPQKCDNCNTDYVRIEGIYALTKVEKIENKTTFHPASGVPVSVFICPKCKKLQLFSAMALGET